MVDHAAAKSAHTKSDEEQGICLKYFKQQSSLTRGFRVGVGVLVYKKYKQEEGRGKLLVYFKFITLKVKCMSLLQCLNAHHLPCCNPVV